MSNRKTDRNRIWKRGTANNDLGESVRLCTRGKGSEQSLTKGRPVIAGCAIPLILLIVLLLAPCEAENVLAQAGAWTEPVNISNTPRSSWFPDMAVDSLGNVHVIWCETTRVPMGHKEQVYYSVWNGQTWSDPNDIVPPSPDIIRNAITTDQTGHLHMLFGGSVAGIGHLSISYMNAPTGEARSAARWSTPHPISGGSNTYEADIASDSENTIHVIYDELVRDEMEIGGEKFEILSADIFYRRSTDGGRTWSYPINLFPSSFTGSAREQMEIDSGGTIHVTWAEGWPQLLGRGRHTYSMYTSSPDGGMSWRSPISVTYPATTTAQLTPGADGQGGVMLVWRSTAEEHNGIYYQWSDNGGSSWSPPAAIPDIFTRRWGQTPFDLYDMATDSAGHIHLVAVAQVVPEFDAPLGVYHLEWDGVFWSRAEAIYTGEGFPEYPKIAISQGNQLHIVWFVRDELFEDVQLGKQLWRDVWYSSSQSAAPPQTPVPSPTPAPTPTTTAPATSSAPPITPLPTLNSNTSGLPDGLYTDSDEVLQLMIALSPVALLIVLVVVVRLCRSGKLLR